MILGFFLQIQDSIEIDTTGFGYRVGHTFGSWLPYILIAFIFIMILRKRYKKPD